MLGIIQAAREAGKCSIAQRLYANRAQAGDVPIALAYAQEYDPAGYKGKRLLQGGRRYSCVLVSGRVGQGQGQRTGAGTPEGSAEMRNMPGPGPYQPGHCCARSLLLQEGKKTLYQRVLTTPGCALHEAPGGKPGAVQPTFSRFYVYAGKDEAGKSWSAGRTGLFWQDAGLARQVVHGGLEDADVLAFTNPAGRDRMLFSRTDRPWTRCSTPLTQSKDRACAPAAEDQGQAPGIVAQEPELFVDMAKNFYLLPILGGEEVMTEQNMRVRVLNVASVSAADAVDSARRVRISPQRTNAPSRSRSSVRRWCSSSIPPFRWTPTSNARAGGQEDLRQGRGREAGRQGQVRPGGLPFQHQGRACAGVRQQDLRRSKQGQGWRRFHGQGGRG